MDFYSGRGNWGPYDPTGRGSGRRHGWPGPDGRRSQPPPFGPDGPEGPDGDGRGPPPPFGPDGRGPPPPFGPGRRGPWGPDHQHGGHGRFPPWGPKEDSDSSSDSSSSSSSSSSSDSDSDDGLKHKRRHGRGRRGPHGRGRRHRRHWPFPWPPHHRHHGFPPQHGHHGHGPWQQESPNNDGSDHGSDFQIINNLQKLNVTEKETKPKKDRRFKVKIPVQNFERKDLKICHQNGELIIDGKQSGDTKYGFAQSSITHRIRLPDGVDPKELKVVLRHGMLKIKSPKSPKADKNPIEIIQIDD